MASATLSCALARFGADAKKEVKALLNRDQTASMPRDM